MDMQVRGAGPVEPFLGARDLFVTERDLDRPVTVRVVEDPDERTRASHTDDAHRLMRILVPVSKYRTGEDAVEMA